MKDDDTARWFTVSSDATRTIAEATMRAALVAQRDRLHRFYIPDVPDRDWPADVLTAVQLAEDRMSANSHEGIPLTLNPRVDEDFEIALALAPLSIECTGIGLDGAFIWDANDTGTSTAFTLTPTEELAVRAAITEAGGSTGDLTGPVDLHLGRLALNYYDVVDATAPAVEQWQPPEGWRAYEHTIRIGAGPDLWDAASSAVLSWGIKTRSGFTVDPPLEAGRRARQGERYWLVARIGPVRVREPVEIITTISTRDRAALAYGTLEGHPVSGEEAFIVHRDDAGNVSLTLRSLTRAGRGPWRWLFPLILVAQRVYRRRYLRALQPGRRTD